MTKRASGRASGQDRLAVAAVAGAAVLAVLAALPRPARAAENGVGFYLLGSRGPMVGYLPPPGAYLQNDLYYYDASGGGNKSFPAGGRIIADVDSTAVIDFVTGTWVLPPDILGGKLAVGAIVPFGHAKVDADVSINPRNLASLSGGTSDDATVFGDPVLSAVLGWHSGKFHWNTSLLVNVPVGDYRDGEIANIAFHRWGADLSGAVTWYDPEMGVDLSAAAGFTVNGKNHKTDYTTGTEFHIEWAATKTVTKEWSVGVLGYHYQQISGDSGEGARLGSYKGRVTALGATTAYNFDVGGTAVTARLKVFREFAAVNRLEGTSAFFTVSLPLNTGK